jgi:EAL domain-containing protein (putative c-di-GMP-specific phosphodiesterase class I)
LVQLEDDLQRGLERGEFEVHYQPIISLPDGKIFGVEALLRWHHPQRGLVPAAEFIPAAEATGLINPLGDWLLLVACSQLKEWREAGHSLMLSVNLSKRQLEGDLGNSILRVLQNTGTDPHALQIEIPEAGMMEQSRAVIPQLRNLKERGVQISMDDSSGSSVLSSFSKFPLSSIKLNRPFVQRINDQMEALNIQRLIEVAHGQGLNVTAVGVETQEQLEFLQAQYCNFAQGYLLGRPTSAQELAQSLLKSTKDAKRAAGSKEKK